jgi:hypothetical protein
MQPGEIIRTIESAGGELWIAGERLGYRLPESAASLVDELQASKWELLELLRQRPAMPPGVRLVRWQPLPAPVSLNRWLKVLDTGRFVEGTLRQLSARLSGDDFGAGNWSLSELLEFLERVGVTVTIADGARRLH